MTRYTDELDAIVDHAQALRVSIAERLAEEAGRPAAEPLTEEQLAAADAAIDAWRGEGEEQQDLAAFRDIGPLQRLLVDYVETADRIDEMLDRRLS